MRTNIMLNEDLIEEAFKYSSNINSKRELVEIALKEYVENRKMKNLKEIKGKIRFADNYDYKSMRA
jgi:Arc/MetJ family transcription regulator